MKFEEAKKQKCACVYKLTYPDGKCYIGQTKCLCERIKLYESQLYGGISITSRNMSALAEFGVENVDVSVVSEISSLSKSDLILCLSILEIKYIREFNTLYPNGYNSGIGGEILGIPTDLICTSSGDIYWNKPVLVYDINGDFISEYPSIAKCAYSLGVDSNTVSSKLDKRNSLLLNTYLIRSKRYGEIPKKIIGFQPKVVSKVKKVVEEHIVYKERPIYVRQPTLKYTIDGDFCGEYETRIDAALSIGRKNISYGVPIRGYIFFKHDGGDIKQNIGKIEIKSKRLPKYSDALNRTEDLSDINVGKSSWRNLINDFKIEQYSIYGELVGTYDSIKDASQKTGVSYSGIWACVFGRTKKSSGYIWKKLDD